MKKIQFKDEKGNKIENIVSIIKYLDGMVVLTKDGTIYTDVIDLQRIY
jgi:hypothetical protein